MKKTFSLAVLQLNLACTSVVTDIKIVYLLTILSEMLADLFLYCTFNLYVHTIGKKPGEEVAGKKRKRDGYHRFAFLQYKLVHIFILANVKH